MFLHQSAYIDYNLYCAGYSGHKYPDWKIERWEEECVNTHIWVANWQFANFELPDFHWVAQVAFLAEVALVLVCALCVGWAVVHRFLCTSSMSADLVQCHFGKKGVLLCSFDEAYPGVFPLQHSPFDPKETQLPLLLFSDIGPRLLDQVMSVLYCGAWNPSFAYSGHIQGQAHVRLFKLDLTSLPCHSSIHVDNLQEISCCLWQWELATTTTIYALVASSTVIKACLVHSRGCISRNLSATIPLLTISWCLT